MHLAIAAHDFYPDPGSGGTGRYVYETARRFVERGHRVSVVTRRRGDIAARGTVDGVDVYRYDVDIADRSAPDILPQLPGAARAVREVFAEVGTPDVVSFQGPVTSLLADRVVDRRVPRSCTFHSPWPEEYGIRTRDGPLRAPRRRLNVELRRLLEGRLLSGVDDAVTLSEFMRERLARAYGVDAAVVPGGVDAERFRPDAGSFDRFDADGTAFLTVRRLSPRMGHAMLLRAFDSVVADHPDAHLYVAGDGPLRERLTSLADRLGLSDSVTFLGYVPDADLPAAYAAADAFVLPTTELEGFGLATLEALASGTPVVATPVGGTVEVLQGCADHEDVPAPMLVPDVDAAALADCLREWAALPEAAREAAGRRCRRHATERYPWERTVDRLERRYERIARDAGDGRPVSRERAALRTT